jgi:hypothetical protein
MPLRLREDLDQIPVRRGPRAVIETDFTRVETSLPPPMPKIEKLPGVRPIATLVNVFELEADGDRIPVFVYDLDRPWDARNPAGHVVCPSARRLYLRMATGKWVFLAVASPHLTAPLDIVHGAHFWTGAREGVQPFYTDPVAFLLKVGLEVEIP